ncbi:flagellar brake protein [Shewanella saliphila]|uniref:Pilus assembly protein PilZ n=1 Tax=Shewanella saliphila TaxID=2282698 RepID=A0ABQ2Q2J7_9GAMM|nr:flagellar brake protein [Shewanella saliphila]MCL1100523.1 flagellar brake protein [Shewanella saliphila]GGP40727.1 pilus assembly protein PilZ [Shewanella saliphila]
MIKTPVSELLDDLRLIDIGMELFVEIHFANGKKVQSRSSLIGYQINRFLLIEYPTKDFSEAYQHMLANAEIVVRAMTNSGFKDIIAFKTSILSMVNLPVRMLCLSVPKSITKKKVREQLRVDIEQDVFIMHNDNKIIAKMLDFSLTGCFVTLAPKSITLEQDAEIHVAISIDESLSGILTGTAVKVQQLEGEMTVGVKFSDDHPELKNQLFSYFLVNSANK